MNYSIYTGGKSLEVIQLFKQSFSDSEGAKEGAIIEKLVTQLLEQTPPEDIRVFIARSEAADLVGGVVFTRIRFEENPINAWMLSPAAVASSFQGKGIGQGLIKFAHNSLENEGVELVVSYGDIQFYSKLGYQVVSQETIPAPMKLSYPEGWIANSFKDNEIQSITGKSFCVEAFNTPKVW